MKTLFQMKKISIEFINNDEFENIELFAHAEDTNLKVKKLKSSFEVLLDNNIGSLNSPIDFSISNGNVYEEISFDFNKKTKTDPNHLFYNSSFSWWLNIKLHAMCSSNPFFKALFVFKFS
ncbi:MAG: hypothetical protein CM15mP40_05040 [Alphaproteobacteria bacterium]|nr:MAG: hypothetical protein CM15mP40_05040 [Alphaproteobacteria bacterium]